MGVYSEKRVKGASSFQDRSKRNGTPQEGRKVYRALNMYIPGYRMATSRSRMRSFSDLDYYLPRVTSN